MLIESVRRVSELLRARRLRPGRWLKGLGVEYGAHDLPLPGIHPVYIDRFTVFARRACRVDVLAETDRLPFESGALDYVAASHVLEHLPNPGRALIEWYRVVRPGGLIYLVVPDRRYTFDEPRTCTPVSHLLEDLERGVDGSDLAHVEDYAMKRDLTRYAPGAPRSEWPAIRERLRAELEDEIGHGRLVNMHYHVFEPSTLLEFLDRLAAHAAARLDWELLRVEERYPPRRTDGILALIRVRKRCAAGYCKG